MQLRTLARQKQQLEADLAKVATRSKQSTEVRAAVLAGAAVTAGVAVSYTVRDAGWSWIYQARLDTTKRHLVFDRQGSVVQGSGEDWKNVELTLTTATPPGQNANVGTPVVEPLFVDLRPGSVARGRCIAPGVQGFPGHARSGQRGVSRGRRDGVAADSAPRWLPRTTLPTIM